MVQYAALSFKISGAKDETRHSDNLFRGPEAHNNTRGNNSGNTGNNNTHGSFNNINKIVLPSVTHFEVPHQGSARCAPGAGEAGIIRISERFLAKN